MIHRRIPTFLTSILLAVLTGPLAAQSLSPLEIVATTSANGLEGLDVAGDGTIYVTNAASHVIHKISADGTVSEFAKLTVVPQVIVLTASGAVVTAQRGEPNFAAMRTAAPTTAGRPFAPALSASMMGALDAVIVILDKQGRVVKTLAGAPGSFFNGMARFGKTFLIADSAAGTIWQFNPSTGTITAWLKDDALLGPDGRFPGANGIKVAKGNVYVSNTVRGAIYRIGVGAGKPRGSLTRIADVPAADDFDVAADGTIYAPSKGSVLKISASGQVSTLAEGCTGCDSALLAEHGRVLLLVTHAFGDSASRGHLYRIRLN